MSQPTLRLYTDASGDSWLEVYPGVQLGISAALFSPSWVRWWASVLDRPMTASRLEGAPSQPHPFRIETVGEADPPSEEDSERDSEDSAYDWSNSSEDDEPSQELEQTYGVYLVANHIDTTSGCDERSSFRVPISERQMAHLYRQLLAMQRDHNRCANATLAGDQLQEDSTLSDCAVSGETVADRVSLWWCRGELSGAGTMVVEDCQGSFSALHCLWAKGEPRRGRQTPMTLRAPVVIMEYTHPATQVSCSHLVLRCRGALSPEEWPTLAPEVALVTVLHGQQTVHYRWVDGEAVPLVMGEGEPPLLEGVYLLPDLQGDDPSQSWILDSRPRVCVAGRDELGNGYRPHGERGSWLELHTPTPRLTTEWTPGTVWLRETPAKRVQ